jgi:beta-1,4-mannosyltransferase
MDREYGSVHNRNCNTRNRAWSLRIIRILCVNDHGGNLMDVMKVILDPIGYHGVGDFYENLMKRPTIKSYRSFYGALWDRASIIHFNWVNYEGFRRRMRLRAKIILCKIFKIRIIWTIHNVLPHSYKSHKMVLKTQSLLAKNTDFFTFFSHADKLSFEKTMQIQIPSNRFCIHPCGPSPMDIPLLDQAQARSRLGLPLDKTLLLYFGPIYEYKGVVDLLDALALYCQENPLECPRLYLIIIGRTHSKSLQLEITHKIERLHENIQIMWTQYFIKSSILATFMIATDLFVFPFRSINNSSTFLTAKRFAAKLVTSKLGSMVEHDAEFGNPAFFFEPNNIQSLVQTLKRAIHSPEYADPCIDTQKVQEMWDRVYDKIYLIYEKLTIKQE